LQREASSSSSQGGAVFLGRLAHRSVYAEDVIEASQLEEGSDVRVDLRQLYGTAVLAGCTYRSDERTDNRTVQELDLAPLDDDSVFKERKKAGGSTVQLVAELRFSGLLKLFGHFLPAIWCTKVSRPIEASPVYVYASHSDRIPIGMVSGEEQDHRLFSRTLP
jgi:hypothetical protein